MLYLRIRSVLVTAAGQGSRAEQEHTPTLKVYAEINAPVLYR